jgi:hypothetical protein
MALHDDRHRAVEIGVVEDDLRRLAAQFQHALHRVLRRRLLHQRADLVGAGEGDEVDAGMRGQRGARLLAQAGDDVERALGQPGRGASSATRSADRLVSSAGFSTVALPIASAGATVRPSICAG